MTTCIIAEKPSVARDIARIVGADSKQDGYMEGNGYLVTWTPHRPCHARNLWFFCLQS